MSFHLPVTVRSATLLVGVVGTAAGLNLSVMALGSETDAADAETAAPALEGDGPEVRRVTVDVPLPAESSTIPAAQATAAPAVPTAAQPVGSPRPASVAAAPLPTAAPTPAAPTATPTPAVPAEPTPNGPNPAAPAPTTPAEPAPTRPAPTTTKAPVTTTTPAPTTTGGSTTEYLTYTFDGVADIVIAYHDNQRLEFWSATPAPGWAFMVEKDRADKIELKFRRVSGGEGEAKFALIREDGELEVKMER